MKPFTPTETMLMHYLQDKLSTADEEKVELWLMEHPEAVDDLKLDLLFTKGVKPEPAPIKKPAKLPLFTLFKPWPAMAAGAALGFITASVVFLLDSGSQADPGLQPNIQIIDLNTERSASDGELYITTHPSEAYLVILLSGEYVSESLVAKFYQAETLKFTVADLETDSFGYITVGIPTRYLDTGKHKVIVTGEQNNDPWLEKTFIVD